MIDALFQAGNLLDRQTEDGLMDVAGVAEVYGQAKCLRFLLGEGRSRGRGD